MEGVDTAPTIVIIASIAQAPFAHGYMPTSKSTPRSRVSAIQRELRQTRPFRSVAQEATVTSVAFPIWGFHAEHAAALESDVQRIARFLEGTFCKIDIFRADLRPQAKGTDIVQ